MFYPLVISCAAGVSTAIGAITVVCLGKITDKQMSVAQGFAAGVMLAVSVLDILPESFKGYYLYMDSFNAFKSITTLFITGWVMGMAISGVTGSAVAKGQTDKMNSVKRMAFLTTAVMVFHNMPEGVLTFFSSANNLEVGIRMAVAVALHNIPEGMAIAAPVLYTTQSRSKVVGQSFAAGMAEPVAGLAVYTMLHNYITPAFLNGIMPVVAGIMCQAAICELLPGSVRISNIKHSLYGIIGGIIIMSIGLIVF